MTTSPPDRARSTGRSGGKTGGRANGLATRRRLIRAATSLFAACGYEATSLRQIASAADVDLATLKYHFGDKPGLFAEVYRLGHEDFIQVMGPFLDRAASARTRDDVRALIHELVRLAHVLDDENPAFIRLVMFRLLEDSNDHIGLEDELQGVAIALIDRIFRDLVDRGLMQPIDTRAFVAFLVSGFAMWFVSSRVKGKWVGDDFSLRNPAGRARSEAFFRGMLERAILLPETAAAPSAKPEA